MAKKKRKRPDRDMVCRIHVSHGKRGTRIGAMLTPPTLQELMGQPLTRSQRALFRPPYPVIVSLRPDQEDAEQVACTLDRLAAAIREKPDIVTREQPAREEEIIAQQFPKLAD